LEELALEYQQTGDEQTFERIISNQFISSILWEFSKRKVWGMDTDDLRQELLIELEKACRNYNGNNKISTLFWRYAERRIYGLRQSAGYQKRKAHFEADSYEKIIEGGFDFAREQEDFGDTELMIYLGKLGLNEKELAICKMAVSLNMTKSEMARAIGVTPSTIDYYTKRIRKKMDIAV
jgi:RNA polymerase sigma factor (sigma-70 family)